MSEKSQQLQQPKDAITHMMDKMLLNVSVRPDRNETTESLYYNFEIQLPTGKEYCIGFWKKNQRKDTADPKNWRFDEANVWFDPDDPVRNQQIEDDTGDPARPEELEGDLQSAGLTLPDLVAHYLPVAIQSGKKGFMARQYHSAWPR